MSSAQGREVARAGGAALGVGGDVVAVAPACRPCAPGEDAAAVAQLGLFAEPVGDLVGMHADVLVEVDDGLDGDVGVGVGAPVLDLLGGDAAVVVSQPGQLRAVALSAGAGDGGFGEVHVEDDLARIGGDGPIT